MVRGETLLALSMVVAANVAMAAEPSPHGGWQERSIKALSPQQIEEYLEGRGMGMALPAELNGYPGPRHVLELANELDLTARQLAQTEQLFEDMRRKAIELGEEIVEREANLDELFGSGTANEAAVYDVAEALGRLRGQLRAHHLSYHLAMHGILDPHQVQAYQHLRGYTASDRPAEHRRGYHRDGGH